MEGNLDRTGAKGSAEPLPREVECLFRREREIATIVYELGAATANDVQSRLSSPVANGSIRSMLNRLVKKGILVRWRPRNAFIYMPALTRKDSREGALVRFADDYFGGSVHRAAQAMSQLVQKE